MNADEPQGVRVQFADGVEREPDVMLYAGRRWRRGPGLFPARLDRWELYVLADDLDHRPVGFTADTIPGRCEIIFHIRLREPNR